MGNSLLLVGSVPLDTVEEVMRTFGGALAPYLPAVPDGEVGERRSWVNRFGYQIFNGHLDLDTIRRPKPIDGVEQLLPRGRDDFWQFKVKPGVERVRFGNPGSRLGYARDAINSYFVFRTLREKGILPPGVRFQISIPMVNSVIRPLYFPDPADLAAIRPGFEAALAAEARRHRRQDPARGFGDPVGLRLGTPGRLRRRQSGAVGTGSKDPRAADRPAIERHPEGRGARLPFLLRHVRRLARVRARRSRPHRSS